MTWAGTREVAIEDLEKNEKTKSMGPRHNPVSNLRSVRGLDTRLESRGFEVADRKLVVRGDEYSDLWAFWKVRHKDLDGLIDPKRGLEREMAFQILMVRSTVQKVTDQLWLGGEMECCSNGMILGGNLLTGRKQTTHYNQSEAYDEALGKYLEKAGVAISHVRKAGDTKVTDEQGRLIILQEYLNKTIPDSSLRKILGHWEKRAGPDTDGRTMLHLYGSCSRDFRGMKTEPKARRTRDFTRRYLETPKDTLKLMLAAAKNN
jgi:hypothetical protein